ncbi:hypothetical protein [Streptomyces sp. NPDC001933]|uniref:hypothetical protein n=1 Tax=Streptomyces sp. NPDC001933 TaxID=3364626 RepID=UPI0036C203C4
MTLGAGGLKAPALEQRKGAGKWFTLADPAGGLLLLPHDHGQALLRATADLASQPSNGSVRSGFPLWMDTPSGQERASTVLRRIRLFVNRPTVDFRTALPGDAALAGPHPQLLTRTRRPRVIAVVNSKSGHGCSSLAAGLSQALADQDHRVLYLLTSRGKRSGSGLWVHRWPEADPGLSTVAQDPERHIHSLPGLGHAFVRCSTPGADGPDQARQLALLLRHPSLDRAFSHVVIDASPTGLPHAAASTADLTLAPWRRMPHPPGREVTEVHLTALGKVWDWIEASYRDFAYSWPDEPEKCDERLDRFVRETGRQEVDGEFEDGAARRLFLRDSDEAGRQRWGAQWEEARDGWIAHLLRKNDHGWDEAAGRRTRRTLSDQEWKAALQSKVGEAADEVLWDLPVGTGRRRPWLVPTTQLPADVVRTIGEACSAQGLRLASTIVPDVGSLDLPASRSRWKNAVRQLTGEACAQLPR